MPHPCISAEAQAFLDSLPPYEARPRPPEPGDKAAWAAWQARIEDLGGQRSAMTRQAYADRVSVSANAPAAGLASLTMRPHAEASGRAPVLFLHGGAYTAFSAASSLFASIPLAAELQTSVTSLDYPLAPAAGAREIVSRTADAVAALLTERMVIVGDSAGGGLALAVTHALQQRGAMLPRALVLWSPWIKLDACDPAIDDPILRYERDLEYAAACYASGLALDDPVVSPFHATYGSWFPPTLIQMGSREILAGSIRALHHRMLTEGAFCQLIDFPGMYHSFPTVSPHVPETRRACELVIDFVNAL